MIGSLNDSGVPTIWLPMVLETQNGGWKVVEICKLLFLPLIVGKWKMANYLKGNDPIGDTPIFEFHTFQ